MELDTPYPAKAVRFSEEAATTGSSTTLPLLHHSLKKLKLESPADLARNSEHSPSWSSLTDFCILVYLPRLSEGVSRVKPTYFCFVIFFFSYSFFPFVLFSFFCSQITTIHVSLLQTFDYCDDIGVLRPYYAYEVVLDQ
jgi:hypothetical protein